MDHGKSKSRSQSHLFRGEEGSEDLLQHLLTHTGSRVFNGQKNMIPFGVCVDRQPASSRHGLQGIDDQVHDHLVELDRVSKNLGQLRAQGNGAVVLPLSHIGIQRNRGLLR